MRDYPKIEARKPADDFTVAVYQATRSFPREEIYGIRDQIHRSSRSVGANLAEALAKRRYPAHFLSKLTDADGELQETMHRLGRAAAYGYLDQNRKTELEGVCAGIGRKLGKMMQNPDSFG
jgi:four helix bundle protein